MPEPERPRLGAGDLLVATPLLLDPNFARSVVLLLDLDENGALGVILNRPSTLPVAEILPDWVGLAGTPEVLFQGGPVSTDSALAIGAAMSPSSQRLPGASGSAESDPDSDPVGFRRLYDSVGIVDLDTPTEIVAPALRGLRIFAGYAGWGEEQLQAEILSGSWYVVPSTVEDLFGSEPLGLWRRVLRRQPGALAWVSTQPLDPTMN